MKKRTLIFSLLLVGILSIALSVGITMAKYFSTLPSTPFDITINEHNTYAYAVVRDGKLSIRNRSAVIIENGSKLIDSEGTYDLANVYALPDTFNANNISAPTGVTNTLKLSSLKTTLTSIKVEGALQGSFSSMFAYFTALQTADFENADFTAVTSTYNMFDHCSALTSIIFADSIDTSNVTNMYGMFGYCAKLTTVNVSGFDTAKVTTMMNMFHGCESVEVLDISDFDTSKVTDMQEMFRDCLSVTELDVSGFNVSNVTTFRQMFYNCKKITNLDFSGWGENMATTTFQMFAGCTSLTSLDLSNLDTSNVTNMSNMFGECQFASLDLSVLDTSNVINMSQMFQGCQANITFGGSFNTSNVTNMSNMFAYCTRQTGFDLTSFNTSNVTNMSKMFFRSNNITSLDLSSFDTSKVTNMSGMFGSDRAHIYKAAWTTIIVSKDFVIKSGADTLEMFRDCNKLVGGNGTKYNGKQDGTYARIDGANGLPGYFTAPTHTHQGGDNWVGYVDELHGKYCSVYGEPLETEEHTYVNGKCEECNYSCQHSKIELLPNEDGTTHSGICPTCNTNVSEEHTYTDGVCNQCQYECQHTVSEWTISEDTHSGTCTICNIAVNEAHIYTDGKCVCGKEETTEIPAA